MSEEGEMQEQVPVFEVPFSPGSRSLRLFDCNSSLITLADVAASTGCPPHRNLSAFMLLTTATPFLIKYRGKFTQLSLKAI